MTEEEEFEFRHRLEREIAQKPVAPKIGAEGFSDALRDTMRSKSWLERNAAAVGNFPSQVYEGAKQIIGKEDPTAIRAGKVMGEEAPVGDIAGTIGTLSLASLVPGANSFLGQTAMGLGTGALMPTEGDESRLKNALTGGLIAGPTYLAMKGLGGLASKWLQGSKNELATTASQNGVRDETIKLAQAEGLKLPRSVTGGGIVSEELENFGMRGQLAREFSRENQPVVNKIARREAGLGAEEKINEKTLAAARTRLAEPYREVEALAGDGPLTKPPFKSPGETFKELQQARADAKAEWTHYGRSADPKDLKEAQRLSKHAELLEDQIEAVAKQLGKPDLVERLRQARTAMAKNFDVEAAVNKGNGNVDAKILGRMYDKRGEEGMTGGLATIGRAAQAFESYFNEAATGTSKAGGYGLWNAVLAPLSKTARTISLSDFMQGTPKYSPGMTARLSDLATNSNSLRTLVPTGSAVLTEQDR